MSELPILPSGQEQIETRDSVFLPDGNWQEIDITNDWLNPEDEWETAKNVLYIDDAPICSLGGLTILTGQSGQGKTMTLSMLISAIFRKKEGKLHLSDTIEKPTVLYVDTEMEKYNTQRLMNRVYYKCNWEFKTQHAEFRILRLRSTPKQEDRLKKVWKAISETKPTFCILDGLLDLVRDFNDNTECSELISNLMAAAEWYGMSITGVIHQNPGGEKMAGHLGSFGERKAINVMTTKKDKTNPDNVIFIVEQKKARDKDASSIKFTVNDDALHIGIPVAIDANEETKEDTINNDKVEQLIGAMIATDFRANGKSWTELEGNLKAAGYGRNQRQRMIKEAVEYGILKKADNGRYYIVTKSETLPQSTTAPF